MNGLKFFVWFGVLGDWTDGIAFSIAYSKDEAVKLLKAELDSPERWEESRLDGVEPIEISSPKAVYLFGGS